MKKITLLLFFFVCCSFSYSQTDEELTTLNEIGQLNIQEDFVASQVVSPSPVAGNIVFVEQIGIDNFTSIQVTSSQSKVEVVQNGANNLVDLNYNAAEINSLVVQNGNNNTVTDFSFDALGVVNTLVTQNGDNLTVQKFGSNSISNGLKINQTGSFKTIIVNSF